MSNVTINQLPVASTIDATQDLLPIYTASSASTQAISRNTYLGLASAPVGLTDSQTLTNKILTSPTLNTPTVSSPTFSGTISGTYTIGGTPTFPSSVVTLTGSQTLTNKVLTSPVMNTPTLNSATLVAPTIQNATLSADTITGFTVGTNGTIYGVGVTGGVITTASVSTSSLVTGIQTVQVSKNPYKFGVWRNAAINSGNGAFGLITFDTKEFDTGSNYNTGTGVFTAPIAGFYQFSWAVGSTGTFTILISSLFKNGSEFKRGTDLRPSTNSGGSNGSALVQLAANDTVDIRCFGSSAVVLNPTESTIYFTGFLVSNT